MLAPVRVVAHVLVGWHLVDIVGHIAEELPHLLEAVLFGLGFVINHPGLAGVHFGTTQVVFLYILTEGPGHYRRAGREYLPGALDHDGEVREHCPGGYVAGAGTQDCRYHRYLVQELYIPPPPGTIGQVHPAALFITLSAGTNSIVELDGRYSVLERHRLHEERVVLVYPGGATAVDGKIFATNGYQPAVYLRQTANERGWGEANHITVLVVFALTHEGADFKEGALVYQFFDALTNGQFALAVVPLNTLLTPHLSYRFPAAAHFLNGNLPGQIWLPGSNLLEIISGGHLGFPP